MECNMCFQAYAVRFHHGPRPGACAARHGGASEHLPPEKTQSAVTYRSGGVGLDESMATRRLAPKYPLELEFIAKAPGGHQEYLAGDDVPIKDSAGRTVLRTESDGPFLLAKLPPGRYSVTATHDGRAEAHAVTIAPRGHECIVFAR